MSSDDQPSENPRSALAAKPPVEAVTGMVAMLGGLMTLAVALLATTSILLRWLAGMPIDGDFEYVKMATAIAVFAYLPYTQARRGNIMVDTFTNWLPQRLRDFLDAFWDLLFAVLMTYLAFCLANGTLGMWRSGETTMQRQIALWPSIAICTALAGLVAVTALLTAARLLRAQAGGARR